MDGSDRNLQLLQKCETKLEARTDIDEDEKEALESKHTTATLRAAEAVGKLRREDVQKIFKDFDAEGGPPPLQLTHRNEPLNSFAEDFWYSTFIELFPYGDGKERDHRRKKHGAPLQDRRWAKTLLLRSDSSRWRLHMEFIACCSNIFLRRAQMRSIALVVRKQWFKNSLRAFSDINVEDLTIAAAMLGEHAGVRAAIYKKDLPNKVRQVMRTLDIVQQHLPYTDGGRHACHRKFTALRLYDGVSCAFLTLNPADTKHQFSILFAHNGAFDVQRVSLDAADEDIAEFYKGLPPLALHNVVANDPVAAVGCFRKLVSLVLRYLLGCTDSPKTLTP